MVLFPIIIPFSGIFVNLNLSISPGAAAEYVHILCTYWVYNLP